MKIKIRNSSKNDGNKIRKVREVLPPVLGLALVVAVLLLVIAGIYAPGQETFQSRFELMSLFVLGGRVPMKTWLSLFGKLLSISSGLIAYLSDLPCPSPPISSPDHPLQRLMKYLLTALFDQPTTRLLMNYSRGWAGHLDAAPSAQRRRCWENIYPTSQAASQPVSHLASQSVHILFMFT